MLVITTVQNHMGKNPAIDQMFLLKQIHNHKYIQNLGLNMLFINYIENTTGHRNENIYCGGKKGNPANNNKVSNDVSGRNIVQSSTERNYVRIETKGRTLHISFQVSFGKCY